MQHNNPSNQSDGDSGRSATSPTDNAPHALTDFTITHQDAGILKQYLDEFQQANTGDRANIIQKAMAEIYQLQPPNSAFDKKEAGKVFLI